MSTGPHTLDVRAPRPPHRLRRALTSLRPTGAVALVAVGRARPARADRVGGQLCTGDGGGWSVLQDGQWIGGSCMVTYVDDAGVAVEGVYSVHAYDQTAADHLGALVMQVDLRDPAHLVHRNPSPPSSTAARGRGRCGETWRRPWRSPSGTTAGVVGAGRCCPQRRPPAR